MPKYLIMLFVLLLSSYPAAAETCTIKMGYRTNERAPLIASYPDDRGLYRDLYMEAARRIGCRLEIVRRPKKRVLRMLRLGEIDFYPGLTFTAQRSEYFYFIANQLPGEEVGVSRRDFPQITSFEQLKGSVVLLALGGPERYSGMDGFIIKRPPELTLEKAFQFILDGRADFYIYNRMSIEYYLNQNPSLPLSLHLDCCGGREPMYLGFSRTSKHFKAIPNLNYSPNEALSVANFPILVDPDSVSAKMEIALEAMAKDGFTTSLRTRYFGQAR